jgi:hypothetical protein
MAVKSKVPTKQSPSKQQDPTQASILEDPLFTCNEVQRALKASRAHVYALAARGQLPCIRWEALGKGTKKKRSSLRFRRSDLLAFIEGHRQVA